MLKKICMLLSIIGTLQVHAMDQPDVCYLAQMPLDIHNLITYFLTCDWQDETEKQFITRTTPEKNIGDPFNAFLVNNVSVLIGVMHYNPAFCCDYSKFVLIRKFYKEPRAKLTLFDLTTDKDERKILYEVELESASYSAVAVSRVAKMFATVETRPIKDTLGKHKKNKIIHTLKINKIGSQLQKIDHVPGHIDTVLAADFNKQGTHIIVHGMLKKQENTNLKPYWIYALKPKVEKNSTVRQSEVVSQTPLQKYFLEKGVCKNLQKKS